jgi:hypothetical protein
MCHRKAQKILVAKHKGKRPTGRLTCRQETITMDFKETACHGVDWTNPETNSFLKMALFHGVN